MIKRFLLGLLLLGFVLMNACGGSETAPEGSVITINPTELAVTNGTATATTSTEFFIISVTDENGIPLDNVRLWISFVYAVPHEYGLAQLYDGDTPQNSPMSAKTDENGIYNLRFDYQEGGGLEYFADIMISSGSASASSEFSVETGSE